MAIMIALAVTATSMTISYSNRAFAQIAALPPEASDQAVDHSVIGGTCPPEQQHSCR